MKIQEKGEGPYAVVKGEITNLSRPKIKRFHEPHNAILEWCWSLARHLHHVQIKCDSRDDAERLIDYVENHKDQKSFLRNPIYPTWKLLDIIRRKHTNQLYNFETGVIEPFSDNPLKD